MASSSPPSVRGYHTELKDVELRWMYLNVMNSWSLAGKLSRERCVVATMCSGLFQLAGVNSESSHGLKFRYGQATTWNSLPSKQGKVSRKSYREAVLQPVSSAKPRVCFWTKPIQIKRHDNCSPNLDWTAGYECYKFQAWMVLRLLNSNCDFRQQSTNCFSVGKQLKLFGCQLVWGLLIPLPRLFEGSLSRKVLISNQYVQKRWKN